jgi:hypothetical protein
LSHLCPYKAHTQDKLMSCLVQKTCTRQYIQNNRELYTLASSATSVHLWHYHQKFSLFARHSWCLQLLLADSCTRKLLH